MDGHVLEVKGLRRTIRGLLPILLLAASATAVRARVPLPTDVLGIPAVSGNGQTAAAKALTREGGVVNTCLTSQDVSAEIHDANGVLLFSATRTLAPWGMWPWDLRNWRASLGPDALLKGYVRFRGGDDCLIGDSQSLDAKTAAASPLWSVAGECEHHCKHFAVRLREDGKFKSEVVFNYEPAAGQDTVSLRAFDVAGHEVAKVDLLHTPASGRYPLASWALANRLQLGTLLVELPTDGYVGAIYTSADGTKKNEVAGWCIPPDHIPSEPCEGGDSCRARLTLIKRVVNDNGGHAGPADWTLTATGPTPISGSSGSAAVTRAVVDVGTYALSESGPAGYTAQGPFVCNGVAGNTVDLRAGSEVTCTITNDDNFTPPATLTCTPGSQAVALGQPAVLAGDGGQCQHNYTWSATGGNPATGSGTQFGTSFATSGSHPVTLQCAGQTATCLVDVSSPEPKAYLTLIKRVVNDNGGHAGPADWTLTAAGPSRINGASGSAAVTHAVVDVGTYALSETGPAGYTAQGPFVCNGVAGNTVDLRAGAEATCTITNDDNPPPPAALTCSPGSQTVAVGQTAGVSGDGGSCQRNYAWSAAGGNPATGSGIQFATSYATSGSHAVTVRCAGQTATCTVNVSPPADLPGCLSFTAQPAVITCGQPVTLTWNTSGATSGTIDHGVGQVTLPGGSTVAHPTTSTSYTLSLSGVGGAKSCTASVTVNAPSGDQGCSPGYWKNHSGSWPGTGYATGQLYNLVFGVSDDYGLTLLEALNRGGGGNRALGRHAVSALLNASHPGVRYTFTPAQVIALVRQAYATGNFDAASNTLEAAEEPCPLN